MHFIYEWSCNNAVVGIFAPVNESVWEHFKLAFWPTIIWWLTALYILRRNDTISYAQWFFSLAAALLICPLVIVCFYYTYTRAFGIESLALDMFSLFLGLSAALWIAVKICKHTKLNRYYLFISIAILVLLACAFTIFTFIPPHIPLFRDSLTGKYGI